MKILTANKFLAVLLLFTFCFSVVKAQEEIKQDIPKTPFKDRLFTGGNIGLQFGSVTYIEASPKIGYKITDAFAAGIGATYIYLKDNRYKGYEYHTDIYGGRVFSQYQVWESVLAYSEFEVLNLEVFDDFTYQLKRKNISSLLVGGGYSKSLGENSNAVIMVLWNLIEDRYSIYNNPIIRVGFNIGL